MFLYVTHYSRYTKILNSMKELQKAQNKEYKEHVHQSQLVAQNLDLFRKVK